MRKTILFLTCLSIYFQCNAQQCLTSGICPLIGTQYPTATLTPTASWQTQGFMNGGNWTLFNVICGNNYEWTYCEAYGGVSTGWDAQLSLFSYPSNNAICFSNDQCGTNGNAPYIKWTASYTGTVKLLTTVVACASNTGSPYNTLAYRQATACTGWAVSPTFNSNTSSSGFVGAFTVTTSASGACYFSVASSASWIHSLTFNDGTPIATTYYSTQTGQPEISTGSTGAYAQVNYVVDANTTCTSRTGTITLYDFCDATIAATYTITEDALLAPTTPSMSTPSPSSVCPGSPSTLTANETTPNCTYQWSSGGSGYQTTVFPTQSGNNPYTVTVTNACGSATNGIVVTGLATPTTPTFSGATSGCNLVSITASSPGCTYSWSNGSFGPTDAFTISGPYTVTATNSSTCTATASVTVTINPNPTVSASAASSPICAGGSGTTLTATSNASQYNWSNGLGSSSTVQVNPSSTTTYTVTVTGNSSCTATAAATVVVNQTVQPNVSISPSNPQPVCSGNNTSTFTATSNNGGSNPQYQWSASNGQHGSSNTFDLTNISSNTSVSCTLTSNAQCASPTSATNSVNIQITPPVTPALNISSSETTLCINSSVTFTTDISNAPNGVQPSSITWYADGGGSIGTGSPFTYGGWSSAGTHTITCIITYASTACVTQTSINSTNTITINVQTQAPAGLAIQGNSTICQNTIDTFSANVSNGGSAPVYKWMINGNQVGTNNSVFASSTLNNNDIITCFITSNSSCAVPDTATSVNSITVTVNPNPTSSAGPDTSVCAGSPVILNGVGNGNCSWLPTIGLSDSTICNPTCTTNVARTYTLKITDNNNCTAISQVTIGITTPSAPIVKDSITSITPLSGKDSSIVCFMNTSINSTSVHWDFGDGYSSNSENPCHIFNRNNAPYIVTLSAYNSCGNASDSNLLQFVILGIPEIADIQKLTISPNPSSGSFTLSFEATQGIEVQIKIYDLIGQLIQAEEPVKVSGTYSKQINLDNVAKGVYILQLQSADGILNKKIEVN